MRIGKAVRTGVNMHACSATPIKAAGLGAKLQGLTAAQIPASCPPPAMSLAQRVSDWLKQLKDAGHLEMNSISTASQLRTASGFR